MTNAPTVKLSLGERTLNLLSRAERKRKGNLMERQQEEFEILNEAFAEARNTLEHELYSCCGELIRAVGGKDKRSYYCKACRTEWMRVSETEGNARFAEIRTQTAERCAELVKHMSHEDGLGMGSLRIEAALRAIGRMP